MNISENLKIATGILQAGEINEPRREAASLLAFALSKDQTFLIAHSEYQLSADEQIRYRDFLNRRASREPFQYITGQQEFYGLNFTVTPDVLIPRPETELIVESALEILSNKKDGFFCEVGIGSGCISVAILHESKSVRAIGLDISESALEIARRNTENNKVANRIILRFSDVFGALQNEEFDLIVSNPPYIPQPDLAGLQPEVINFEPLVALTDGSDGLSIIEKIIVEAPGFLKRDGCLLMEIGFDQADAVRQIFKPELWAEVEVLPDLQSIPRTVKAKLK